MKKHIIKNHIVYTTISSFIQAIILGIYLSLCSNKILSGEDIIKTVGALGNWNILLIIAILLMFFNIWIIFASKINISEEKTDFINKLLENASKAIIFPNANRHIRAIVTICNYRKGTRKTLYSYNIIASPERTAKYDIFFGVTGKAIRNKTTVAEELPENHIETYNEEEKLLVDPNLRCILASPIFSKDNPDVVLGVLAFDSCEPLAIMKFNASASKIIAQSWADIIAPLL